MRLTDFDLSRTRSLAGEVRLLTTSSRDHGREAVAQLLSNARPCSVYPECRWFHFESARNVLARVHNSDTGRVEDPTG